MNELDMSLGWALYGYALTNDPVNRFSGIKLKKSPASNEADKLLGELKEYYKNNKPI
jgi:hypothetical protein